MNKEKREGIYTGIKKALIRSASMESQECRFRYTFYIALNLHHLLQGL